MTVQTQRPASLKVVVFYKGLIALVLAVLSVISAFSWRHYEAIALFAQTYIADGEFTLSQWFLNTVMHTSPNSLRWVARVAGGYAIALGIATGGLWYQKRWAEFLMPLLAGLPIPIELLEAIHDPSWHRLMILVLNIAVVIYLISHLFAHSPHDES
jgi:uncharacterized membrane protein (DUF2068 family)